MKATTAIPIPITLTERAANHAKSLLQNEAANQGKSLRIFVEGACCSGLEYGLLFDSPQPGDCLGEFHGLPILIDPDSARHLRGAVVDYAEPPSGSGFTVSQLNDHAGCDCRHNLGD
jgi:iron-sulfur cluster assembly protein